MNREENEVKIIDPDEYTGSWDKGVTFQSIVFNAVANIVKISTSEFSGGYWTEKIVNVGSGTQIARTYVEDKRESYNNAVDCLHDLLLPQFDEAMSKVSIEINHKVQQAFDKLINQQLEGGSVKTEWVRLKLQLHRRMFQELSKLLSRVGYLAEKVYTDS